MKFETRVALPPSQTSGGGLFLAHQTAHGSLTDAVAAAAPPYTPQIDQRWERFALAPPQPIPAHQHGAPKTRFLHGKRRQTRLACGERRLKRLLFGKLRPIRSTSPKLPSRVPMPLSIVPKHNVRNRRCCRFKARLEASPGPSQPCSTLNFGKKERRSEHCRKCSPPQRSSTLRSTGPSKHFLSLARIKPLLSHKSTVRVHARTLCAVSIACSFRRIG